MKQHIAEKKISLLRGKNYTQTRPMKHIRISINRCSTEGDMFAPH